MCVAAAWTHRLVTKAEGLGARCRNRRIPEPRSPDITLPHFDSLHARAEQDRLDRDQRAGRWRALRPFGKLAGMNPVADRAPIQCRDACNRAYCYPASMMVHNRFVVRKPRLPTPVLLLFRS